MLLGLGSIDVIDIEGIYCRSVQHQEAELEWESEDGILAAK